MFHRYGKKGTSLHAKPLKDLTRIVAAENLLAEEKRTGLFGQIKDCSALEPARFDSLCLPLVHNFVNHCQNLPETSNSYYSQQGGLIDHALNRTESALNLFKQYLIADENAEFSEEQKLWQYALFSAAILQGIGKLQIDYTVQIYDNNGQYLKQWNPLLESLALIGSYYLYAFNKETNIEFRRRLNILMARLLMPASGYAWIASNPQVLAVWLALLNEDPYTSGTLGAILIRADAIAIQRYLNQFGARAYGNRGGGRYGRANTFTGGVPESLSDKEFQTGVEFIQWLTKSLAAGIIMINKAPLLSVPGGLLMSPEMFKWFVREHPEYKNWQAIQNGFLSLGLHRINADGGVTSRFEQQNNQQMHEGIVCENYGIFLPPEVQLHNLNTGKSTNVSALDLIHVLQFNNDLILQQQSNAANALLYLNKEGQWQTFSNAAQTSTIKPGAMFGA